MKNTDTTTEIVGFLIGIIVSIAAVVGILLLFATAAANNGKGF